MLGAIAGDIHPEGITGRIKEETGCGLSCQHCRSSVSGGRTHRA